jgi:hypothetical protein
VTLHGFKSPAQHMYFILLKPDSVKDAPKAPQQ